jgi:hypothetical protein
MAAKKPAAEKPAAAKKPAAKESAADKKPAAKVESATDKKGSAVAPEPAAPAAAAPLAPAATAGDDFSAGFQSARRGRPVKQNVTDPNELSLDFEEDGKLVRKTIKKVVMAKGAWVRVVYLYQDLNRKKNEFGALKVSVALYKKAKSIYQFQKEFSFSSAAMAKQAAEIIQAWIADGSLPLAAEGEDEG